MWSHYFQVYLRLDVIMKLYFSNGILILTSLSLEMRTWTYDENENKYKSRHPN